MASHFGTIDYIKYIWVGGCVQYNHDKQLGYVITIVYKYFVRVKEKRRAHLQYVKIIDCALSQWEEFNLALISAYINLLLFQEIKNIIGCCKYVKQYKRTYYYIKRGF